jgi:hypothetical protein
MVVLTTLLSLVAGVSGVLSLQPTFDSGRETLPGGFIFEYEDGYVSKIRFFPNLL